MSPVTLTLMRHAKSSWNETSQHDHDRPLNARGHEDAPEMARRLLDRGSVPQLILSSSAQRTRQTTEHVLDIFGSPQPEVHFEQSLYLGEPGALLDAVLALPEGNTHIMIIAHNPGIEDLSAHLQAMHSDTMPTAAIRQFKFSSMEDVQIAADTLRRSSSLANSSNPIELSFSDFPKSEQ